MLGRLKFACLLVSFLATPGSFESGSITVDFDRVSATTGDGYVSFNFDWHLNSEEPPAWYDSSVLAINLTNPKLIYLASQLSPGHLRVGGSEEDVAIYDIGAHRPCVEGFCMSMDRWHELVEFCQQAKIRLVFGLNAMYGRSNSTSHWDPSNTKSLLNYTASNKLPVYGFEFGNEIEHKVAADVMAEDYVTLRNMINEMWPDPSSRPWLIGPDENPDADYLKKFLPGVRHVINASTYHVYPGYGLDPKLPSQILTVDYLNKEGGIARSLGSIIASSAPGVEGWVGETAAAWHSGQYNTTNTFLSGFWYLDALSSVAAANQKAFCRQTLIGGNYELLDKNTTDPYPDYYTALLFKRLMGQKVLSVKVDSTIQQSIRAYASCTAPGVEGAMEGAVTVAFLNINNSTSFDLTVTNVPESMADREEFHFSTGEDGNLRSQTVKLAGNLLQLQDGKLPPLSGRNVLGSDPLTIRPLTYGYAVLKNVNAPACK